MQRCSVQQAWLKPATWQDTPEAMAFSMWTEPWAAPLLWLFPSLQRMGDASCCAVEMGEETSAYWNKYEGGEKDC